MAAGSCRLTFSQGHDKREKNFSCLLSREKNRHNIRESMTIKFTKSSLVSCLERYAFVKLQRVTKLLVVMGNFLLLSIQGKAILV